MDAVHQHPLVLVRGELALVDQAHHEVDGPQLAQEPAVERDLREAVLDVMGGRRRRVSLDRVDLYQQNVIALDIVEQAIQGRVTRVSTVPERLTLDLDG